MADRNMVDNETERQLNDYQEFIDTFITGFTTKMYHDGILKEIDAEDLREYFTNPDSNNEIISDLTEYFYISTGEIHMLFELIEALPTLNYKIDSFDKPTNHDKYISLINRTMHKIKHKILTRGILKQTATMGTLTGIWLGSRENIHPYIFDSPTQAFPAYRKNGDWVVFFDLQTLDDFKEEYRDIIFGNLHPYVTEHLFLEYRKSRSQEKRYVALPQERTFVVYTHKLRFNQGLGTGWANSAMFDILHKRKLKNVEQAIANRIVNAIAVLTIGNEKNPEQYGNIKLNPKVKRKVFNGVKQALEAAVTDGIPVVSLPEFAKLDFPDIRTDGLDGKKFEHVNDDLNASLGVSPSLTHGVGGNNASSKASLDVFYKRIAVILEQLDMDMYQKLINLILPKTQNDNYYITYEKNRPLTTKEKIDILMKLNDRGWSVKHVIDEIDGISWEQYLEQTLYETEELELQSRIRPYQSTYTMSDGDSSGAPEKPEDELTPEGESTRTSGKNED